MRKMTRQEWIVIAIAAVLIAAVWLIVRFPLVSHRDPVPPTSAAMHSLAAVIALYHLDHNTYPPSLDVLKPTGEAFDKPYLKPTDRLTDGWGQAIRYTSLTNGYELASPGRDHRFGTDDDIVMMKK